MSYRHILYEKAGGIGWITLNRPEKMNALNAVMMNEWEEAILAAGGDEEVGVVVVTGTGRAYCTGLDLKELEGRELTRGEVGPDYDVPGNAVIAAIRAIPKVVIAMVNGPCITGGLETLLAFDLIVASEEAVFGDTHARWGIRPSWGMSQRLPRMVGWMNARELSFTARLFTAKEAREMGLVNRVVPAGRLRAEVISLAECILRNSLETVAAIKSLYNRGMTMPLKEALEMESKTQFVITDTNERLKTFLKKK
ncbi:MAG TPA: enoyl-CoA hydratase/isomerase family protein [Syntrophales bacterium]|nr:enoyl-CoA hydratase/isomerase family protein [Syntrophales bacterium]HRT62397.1 enoyl-CoA hydratase/isomerase family protein [Syntrophales bacterium]